MKRTLLVVACVAMISTGSASAQEISAQETFTLEEAMVKLPPHERYRVQLAPSDQPAEQQEQLARMIGEAAAGQHFYGAIYSFRPNDRGTTEIKMRSGLHSRDAARRGALADCNAARTPNDTECKLIGEILPEGLSEQTPTLSHVAVQALQEIAGEVPGNVVVARSRSGDGFEILAGEDVLEAAIAACNKRNVHAALPPDCEVVIDDLVDRR